MTTATVDRQVEQFRDNFRVVRDEVSRVIVGNDDNIVGIMTCLLARGHVLLEGIPGIGKTKLVQTLADVLHLKFARIQFTPDLMPGDIIGTNIVREDERRPQVPGVPAAARSSPTSCWPTRSTAPRPRPSRRCSRPCRRTACPPAARRIRWSSRSSCWPRMNPLEMEGTYPLPEAQLDRFFFKLQARAFRLPTGCTRSSIAPPSSTSRRWTACSGQGEVLEMRETARSVPVARPRPAVRHRPDTGHASRRASSPPR